MIPFPHLLFPCPSAFCAFAFIIQLRICNMATEDEDRKASTASAPDYGLANEDDAAVLGRSRYPG